MLKLHILYLEIQVKILLVIPECKN